MEFETVVQRLGLAFEIAGIAVLVVGATMATGGFAMDWQREGLDRAYHGYRANLGRAILLGLEFLVVADIVRTVVLELTLPNLGALALLVLIRSFLSLALEVEISGRWPWRREPRTGPHSTGPAP
jgi:uncharacterized membrane protein